MAIPHFLDTSINDEILVAYSVSNVTAALNIHKQILVEHLLSILWLYKEDLNWPVTCWLCVYLLRSCHVLLTAVEHFCALTSNMWRFHLSISHSTCFLIPQYFS